MPEPDFLQALDILSKTTNRRTYESRARKLTARALTYSNSYYPYRLALELDRAKYPVSEIEDHIIKQTSQSYYSFNYLIFFATQISSADIPKLQKAVIETGAPELMAEFSRVPRADFLLLEQLVLQSKVPRASYIFLSLHSSSLLKQHKQILIKSKKSKYLHKCATLSKSQKEFDLIQDLILKNKSTYYVRLIASHPLANQEKIEDRIIATSDFEEIKKLYQITRSHRLIKYMIVM